MKKVILKGPRVTLRPIQLSDAPNYVRWLNDKKVVRYLLMQQGVTLAEERKYIRGILSKDSCNNNFAIIDENGRHIGSASLDDVEAKNKSAVFGIVIGERGAWGKGYAGECLSLLMDYLFGKMHYRRLALTVSVHNKPAIRAYRKAGFILEGRLRKNKWNKVTKKAEDTLAMSILREEWLKKRKK